MSGYLLDTYPASSTIYCLFDTFAGSTGAPITMSGFATGDLKIYKNGSTTERASTSGFALLDTDGIDFDSITGIHGFSVDLSDNTTAGFYAAGSTYTIVISTITVDSQTMSFVVGTFRIVAAENTSGTPVVDVGRFGNTAVTGRDIGASVLLSAGSGTGQLDFTSGVVKANVTQFNGTNGTFASGRPEVNTSHIAGSAVSTSSAQIGVNVVNAAGTAWGSGAITAASIAADAITAAKIADGAIDAATFAAGAINAAAIASDAITAAKIADGAIDAATFAAGAIDAAAIAADAIGSSELATTAVDEIVDAVWDEVLSGHVTAGTAGQSLYRPRTGTAQAGAAGTITLDASASAVDDFYKSDLVVLTGGTGAGQARTVSGYVGATKVASITPNWATAPDNTSVFMVVPFGSVAGATAPTAAEVADAVWDEATAGHTTSGTFGEQCKTDIDDILTDTGTTLDGRIPAALVSGRIDASVGAMAANVMTAAAAAADLTTELQSGLATASALSTVDSTTTAIKAKTDKLTFTSGNDLDANIQKINDVAITGDGSGTPFNV